MAAEPVASSAILEVRPRRPGDEEALVEMYSSIFRERSLAEWRWLFEHAPAGPADVGVLVHDGRPVGSIAHIPVAVWVGGRQLRQSIGCDLMIVPEYRGRGGAELLAKAFLASEHGFDLNLGCVNEASGHVMGRYAGTVTLGHVPEWIRFQTRGVSLPPFLRRILSAAERLYGSMASWSSPALAATELLDPGAEVDDLARESAAFARCIRVRDAAYLRWRWLEEPGTNWRIRAVREASGALRGFAVIGVRGEGDYRRGLIVELLARDSDAVRALVIDAWRILVKDGCWSVTCNYLDSRPWARRAMFRSGFRPSRGPLMACGPLASTAGDEVTRFDSWYLTSSDTAI